jgi:hypothetical protein
MPGTLWYASLDGPPDTKGKQLGVHGSILPEPV